jgi:hypothetical protein
MPWCPNCKTEYRQGITVCGDCGSELVAEQPTDVNYVQLNVMETEEIAQKLIKYLEYSKIDGRYEYSEQELGFVVQVREEDLKKAQKAFHAFYDVEFKRLTENNTTTAAPTTDREKEEDSEDGEFDQEFDEEFEDNFEEDTEEDFDKEASKKETPNEYILDDLEQEKRKVTKMMYEGGAYEKKREKSKEMKSTAITFFAFGVLGLGFVVLNFLDVIKYLQGPLPYTVMIVMFIGFIAIGFNSLDRAKKAAKDAILEEETTSNITKWLDEQINDETLASMKDSTLSEEANFIRVMEGIKTLVTDQFGQLDDAYLDYVTEEYYNNRFDA